MATPIYMLSPEPGSRIPTYVTATDSKGRSHFENGIPYFIAEDVWVDFSNAEVKDRMLTSGIELILSEKASNLLSDLVIMDGIVRVPCRIAGQNVDSKYFLWYAQREFDILDYEKSAFKRIGGHILSVYEWVVDSNKIPPLDLFMGNTNKWIVSERLVETVFDHDLSGFGFHRLKIKNP